MLNKQIAIAFFVMMNILPVLSFGQCKKWSDKIRVITTDNDTIVGYRKDMKYSFYLTSDKLVYKDEDCAKQKMKVGEVKFVLHPSGRLVVKNFGDWGFALLRLALDYGNIKYYYGTYIQRAYHTPHGNKFNGGYSPEEKIEYHYVEIDGELHKLKNKKKHFLTKLNYLFGDCPEIRKKIEAEEYSLFDLDSIIRIYSEWLEKESEKTTTE